MKYDLDIIEIEWEGPFMMTSIEKLNEPWDYGIYQIYGTHPIFGSDSLLYMGMTQAGSFAERIPAHLEWVEWESTPVQIYVGRLGGTEKMVDKSKWDKWDEMIDRAEKLLIYYSSPPYNSANIKNCSVTIPTLIINYRQRHRIPFLVSNCENVTNICSDNWKVFGKD